MNGKEGSIQLEKFQKKKQPKEFYFAKGNLKLSNNILIWNLPRGKTCPGAGECLKYCYEIKTERRFPKVREARERNLAFSKREDFVKQTVEFLKQRKENIIRVHSSGDFYCKGYFKKWCEIARQLPEKTFYSYTKSYYMDKFWEDIPDNLKIIQSVESRFPNKVKWERSTARVIENVSERKLNEFICPEQMAKRKGKKIKCMEECKMCLRNKVHVCFLKH